MTTEKIFAIAAEIAGRGTMFHLLADTPDQFENHYAVLVDDAVVVCFEILRSDRDQIPREVSTYHPLRYRRGMKGRRAAEFDAVFANAKHHFTPEA